MALCEFCNKWVTQPEGKKKKRFCNSTCRSNFWYAKNMKAKIVLQEPKKGYGGPKSPSNFVDDEPLCFDKLMQQTVPQKAVKQPKTMLKYFEDKRECTCQEDYEAWLAEVEADIYLTPKQKQILKTTNQ